MASTTYVPATLVYINLSPDKREIVAQKIRTQLEQGDEYLAFYHLNMELTEVMCTNYLLALIILSNFPQLKRVAARYHGFIILQCDYKVLTDHEIRNKIRKQGNPVAVIRWSKLLAEIDI